MIGKPEDSPIKKQLVGRYARTTGGFVAYHIADADRMIVLALANIAETRFGFSSYFPIMSPTGEALIDCLRGSVLITIGWNSESGAFIRANDAAGDAATREMGSYMDEFLRTM